MAAVNSRPMTGRCSRFQPLDSASSAWHAPVELGIVEAVVFQVGQQGQDVHRHAVAVGW